MVLVALSALPIPVALLAPSEFFSFTALPVLVAAFVVGLRVARPYRAAAIAAALVAVGQFANTVGIGEAPGPLLALAAAGQALVVVGLPLLPAVAIGAQRRERIAQQALLVAQEAELAAVTRQRDAQLGEAIARERAAMARELHDIAAHHLSGIALMASAIERQATSDPPAAQEGARQVRAQSRAVLDDLRRLVGLLRDTGESDDAIETLATVPTLVSRARDASADVELDVRTGTDRPLGDGIGPLGQLAAYRMVQESLTNAARHAPGAPCTVVVDDLDPSELRVRVRNARPRETAEVSSSGFGLVGMRERAALVAGRFDAGPTSDGGWEARMTVPREPHAPREPEEALREHR